MVGVPPGRDDAQAKLRRFAGTAVAGFLVGVVFLAITLIDGRDLGAPVGVVIGFGLVAVVAYGWSLRHRD